jgi:hypothetical protein
MRLYYIAPKEIVLGYHHLMKTHVGAELPHDSSKLVAGIVFANEDAQEKFENMPGVIPLPHRLDFASKVSPEAAEHLKHWGVQKHHTTKDIIGQLKKAYPKHFR